MTFVAKADKLVVGRRTDPVPEATPNYRVHVRNYCENARIESCLLPSWSQVQCVGESLSHRRAYFVIPTRNWPSPYFVPAVSQCSAATGRILSCHEPM
jgi:hypothetical protein